MFKIFTSCLTKHKIIKLKPSVKRLFFLCFLLLPIQAIFAQTAPNISYAQKNYTFTKGVLVSGFSSPTNSGSTIPSTVSGNVVGSFGIGLYDAFKITKSGDGNLISTMFNKGTVEKVDLTANTVQSTLSNRDKPWGVVKDSQGNVYWTETGSYKIVTNPNQADETSYAIGALDFLGAVGLPGKAGDALEVFNGARDLYSAISGGDDLVRKISGQEENAPYKLKFSGKIYKLAAGSSTATVLASDIQMPTGLAIDENDNLYVSCYTAKFKVQGGLSFAGGAVSKVDDEEGTYNSKVIKIAPNKTITDIGSWGGIDYPTSLGIDKKGNLSMMFYTDNFQKVKVVHILKYPEGQTTGNTYESAKIVVENSTVYQDLAVDAPGNIYLSDFYSDKIYVHPFNTVKNELSVFSDKVTAPKALYVDLATNQLWVKDGKYINTGTINKLSLYGYSVSPTLPNGLFLTTEGKVSGTSKATSPQKNYTITGSNSYGISKDIVSITINQIVAPIINYATTTYTLPLGQSATIVAPTNSGGAFNQQIGPVKVEKIYTHPENYKKMGGFAFDADGNMYFALFDDGKIMKLTPSGVSSELLSGLDKPKDILIDQHTGNIYFSEWGTNRVKLLAPGFTLPIEIVKTGSPAALALTDEGILYIASAGNDDIDKFDIKKNTISDGVTDIKTPMFLSIYNNEFYVKKGDGDIYRVPINTPSTRTKIASGEVDAYFLGMTLDDFGNIYYADYSGFKKIPAGTTTPEAFPIPGVYTYGSNKEIKADADNNIYISVGSYSSSSIYKVTNGGYTVSPALPAGLVLNDNGTITGTPTAITVAKTYTITATNAKGSSSKTLNIAVINLPTTKIEYAGSPKTYYRGTAITDLLPTVTGGKPDSLTISPTLPTGLLFDKTTGKISGTATANKLAADYTITANNTAGSTSTVINITVTEVPPSALSYALATSIQRDIHVGNVRPTITGGAGITYVISPTLPAGLTFDNATGIITGKPSAITASKTYTVTATNNGGSTSNSFALEVKLDPPTNLQYVLVTNNLLRDKAIGDISPTFNGAGISSFSISPALPTGLSFNTTTGIISGTPTAAVTSTDYTITAINDGGSTTKALSLAVYVAAPSSLNYVFSSNSLLRDNTINDVVPTYEGSPATSFSVDTALPTGLTLNTTTGIISGKPTVITANAPYRVTATNEGGSTSKLFSLVIRVDKPINIKYDFAHTELLKGSTIPTVTPSYEGSPATSFSISPALPTGLSFNTSNGVISGAPTVLSGLTNYTVTIGNDGGSSTKIFNLKVTELAPTGLSYAIAVNNLLRGELFQDAKPTYAGGSATSFTVSPSLPSGLTINSATGIISGTPNAITSNTTYTVTGGNSAGSTTYDFSLSVRVDPPTNLVYTTVASILRDITIADIVPTYSGSKATFSINPALPAGLNLNSTTGIISGTPTAITASKSYTVTALNDGGNTTKTFTLEVRIDPPTNLRYSFQNNELVKDIAIDKTSPRYSGSPTNIFSISPSLPAGLSFNTSNGDVTGTPTALKTATEYTVTATNDGGNGVAKFTLAVANIPIPEITYAVNSYKYIKGLPITTIGAPVNTGNAFPQQRVSGASFSGVSNASSVANDQNGNAYITYFEDGDAKIKVLTSGATQLTEFVTSGLGTSAINDIALDFSNNLYVTVGGKIKKITPSKVITDFDASLVGAGRLTVSVDNDLYVTYGNSILKYENCNPALKSTPIYGMDFGSEDVVVDAQQNIYTLRNWIPANQPNHFMEVYKYYEIDNYSAASRLKFTSGVDNSRYLAIDKRGNIYINGTHNIPHIAVVNGYTGQYVTTISQNFSGGNPMGISLDNDQNLFYAMDVLSGTEDKLGIIYQFGYNAASLPAGLVLNEDGTITGTPTSLQNETTHQISAKSFYGTSTANLKIAVVDAIPAFTYTNPNQILTKSVTTLNFAPVSTGGTATSFSIKNKQLPSGITFNTTTGTFSGTATNLQDTTSTYTVYATNTGGTSEFNVSLKIVDSAPTNLVYAANHVLIKDQSFNQILPQVSGGPVTTYSVTPNLPAGVYINPENGTIGGQPISTQASTAYTIKAENSGGFVTATLNITINDIAPSVTYVVDKYRFKKGETITTIDKPSSSGGPVLSYSISGLPAGLSLNTDGSITGTPSQITANTEYELTANGGQWGNGTSKLNIEIFSLPPDSISYSTPYTMVKGTAIQNLSPTYTTSVGDPVTRFTVSPELPTGLSINESTGVISGTPTDILANPGQLYYVYAENGAGKTYAPLVFILKDVPPAISYDAENVFTKGTSISKAVTSTGGVVTKYIISPSLPTGLAIDSLTGLISGSPSVLSVRTKYTITGTNYGNPSATKDIYITVNDIAPIIGYHTNNNFIRTQAISSLSPSSTGGAVVGYTVSPTLPQGLSISSTTGVISGTPTLSTTSANYIITAQNTGGSDTANVVISVKNAAPIISYNNINTFTKGVEITDLEVSSTGGNQITFSISPALPAGLSLNATTGVISGTPTAITTQADYTVTATNDGGNTTSTFKVTVNDKLPGDISYNATNQFFVDYAITNLNPTVSSGGGVILTYAITPTLPTGLSFSTTTGVISGKATVPSSQTTYTVTASNSGGNKQATFNIIVVQLDASISKTDVKCFGGSDGTATVSVSGGATPYTYSWSPSGGTASTATGLTAGTYTVTITDANSSSISRSITIGQPTALTATISSTVISQKNGNDGTATVIPSGGTAPYTYSWSSNGGTALTATGLTEGTHTVTITDAHSCTLVKSIFVDAPPAAPVGLTATPGDTQNTLNWTANSESDVASYKIYAGSNGNPSALIHTVNKPTLSFTHVGLTNGLIYNYKIIAVDGGGNESAYSSNISSTPKTPQSITFNALADKVYGSADYDAGATASSGLNITYSTSNTAVATIVAGKVHIVGIGSVTITASQSGNGLYFPATDQSQSLLITKKTITASLTGTVSKTYDGNTQASLASANYMISGLEIGDVVNLNEPISGTYDSKDKGLSKTVSVTGLVISGIDAINYQLSSTSVSGTVGAVTAKQLTVNASGINKTYDANTTGTVNLSDNRVSGDVLTTAYTTATFDNKNVGTGKTVSVSGISISGTDAANYSFNTTTSTTASVTAKSLAVTASGINKVYDGNTTGTVTLSDNRVSGDVLTAAYTTATFDSKNTGTGKTVSVSGISISGTDATNYSFNTTTSTTASVTAKSLTITADNKDKYEGEVNPVFTVSYSGFIPSESNTVLTTQPDINTMANTSTLRGQYPIVASGAVSQNYAISYVDGTLTIKAEAPTSISANMNTLYENRTTGTLAGTLSSTSLSPFATYTYSLVTGLGSTDNDKFDISGNTIITKNSFDYETQSVFNIRVRSTTQYGLFIDQTFVINLSDVNEVPTINNIADQRIYFQEGVTEYISLQNVTVGPDFNQSVQTSISSSNPGLFRSLSVNNNQISYVINDGQLGTANLTVTVKDNGGTANGGVDQISRSFVLTVDATPVVTGTGTESGTKVETDYSANPEIGKGLAAKLKVVATDAVSYSWSGSALTSYNISNPIANPTQTTTYYVTVTNSKGVSITVPITVSVKADFVIKSDNNFSPNGDGINDTWQVENIENYPNHKLEIIDRSGRVVYRVNGYQNDWNGTLDGAPLTSGTYYYIFNFDDPKIAPIKGFITIVY